MSRPIRLEFHGASYHVTARGNERQTIFKDEADRALFVATLVEAARALGYADGSAIAHAVRRVDRLSVTDEAVAHPLCEYQREFQPAHS